MNTRNDGGGGKKESRAALTKILTRGGGDDDDDEDMKETHDAAADRVIVGGSDAESEYETRATSPREKFHAKRIRVARKRRNTAIIDRENAEKMLAKLREEDISAEDTEQDDSRRRASALIGPTEASDATSTSVGKNLAITVKTMLMLERQEQLARDAQSKRAELLEENVFAATDALHRCEAYECEMREFHELEKETQRRKFATRERETLNRMRSMHAAELLRVRGELEREKDIAREEIRRQREQHDIELASTRSRTNEELERMCKEWTHARDRATAELEEARQQMRIGIERERKASRDRADLMSRETERREKTRIRTESKFHETIASLRQDRKREQDRHRAELVRRDCVHHERTACFRSHARRLEGHIRILGGAMKQWNALLSLRSVQHGNVKRQMEEEEDDDDDGERGSGLG
eukprot:g2962.t1